MTLVPFGEYRPDISTYNTNFSGLISNVIPRGDGYGPWKTFGAIGSALPAGAGTTIANVNYRVLLHFNGGAGSTTITDDAAGGALTWTVAGNAQISVAQSVFGGASLTCDGTGDWVTAADSTDITIGSSNFHINCRVRATANGLKFIAGQCNSTATAASASWILWKDATDHIFFAVSDGSNFSTSCISTTLISNDVWYDIEVGRAGNTLYLFVDGRLEDSHPYSSTINNSANAIRVGAMGEVTTTPWQGFIDEFLLAIGEPCHTSSFTSASVAFDTLVGTSVSAQCRGMFSARKSDGTIQHFAANANKLFTYNTGTLAWDSVTNPLGYADPPTGYHWQFAQFGNLVIAVQPNVPPQVFTLGTSTTFTALGGAPPMAAYIAIVQRFVVLTGIANFPFRIQWSGLEDALNWTSGSNSSDFQDLPDGGPTRGVVGGDFGVVFQDNVIRRLIWNQNPATVFDINKITEEMGLRAPYSLCKAGGEVFFWAQQGFHRIGYSGGPIPIGKEKVDRTFQAAIDTASMSLMIGANDPEGSRVVWMYKSTLGAAGFGDRLIIYDYLLERWTEIGLVAGGLEFLANMTMTDLAPKIAAFDQTHKIGLFNGSNMAAGLETAVIALDAWKRVRVQGSRPISDAASCSVTIFTRDGLEATEVSAGTVAMNAQHWAEANVSGRFVRGLMIVAAGVTWTYATGLDPVFAPEGRW